MKIKVIKIAHCSHSFFLGEGEKELKKLVLNDWYAKFSKQIKNFHPEIEVECWAPERLNKDAEEYEDSNVKFRFFPVTFSPIYGLDFSIPMLKELKREIQKSRKENYKLIIHIHEIHNLHGLLIASFFGKEKLVVQHHGGSWPLKHLRQTKRYKLFFPFFILAQVWENLVLKNVKVFYGLSKDEIDYLKEKVPKAKVKLQTMGIENDYFRNTSREEARGKLGLPLDKKIILYIGRITDIKGIGTILEAMKELRDVDLKIIGFGHQEDKFKDYVNKNNLTNVEFLGGVFGEKKMLYISSANAFVLASSKEGAPVTVMEAMARNIPCVVSDVGGVRLMIEDGKNGIIIRPRSSKDVVKSVREILNWEKRNIKDYANIYKWEKIIEDTVWDYENGVR